MNMMMNDHLTFNLLIYYFKMPDNERKPRYVNNPSEDAAVTVQFKNDWRMGLSRAKALFE